jgi:hypothetical protein
LAGNTATAALQNGWQTTAFASAVCLLSPADLYESLDEILLRGDDAGIVIQRLPGPA